MGEHALDVIVPARNSSELLKACLAAVVPQLGPHDRVVVVDDGSTDDTAEVADRAGAHVLASPQPAGPYVARQLAADRSLAWGLVFLDARCRPLGGWLQAHRELLALPGAALSCSAVSAVPMQSLASRVAAYQQPFRLEATTTGPRLPYYPTCNLGVRRSAFVAVGGFPDVRSGGDAELCWRVQEGGHGHLAVDPTVRVEWQPRDRMRDLLEQWWRYGGSQADLALHRSAASAGALGGRRLWERGRGVTRDVRTGQVTAGVAATSLLMEVVQRAGYLRGRRLDVDPA